MNQSIVILTWGLRGGSLANYTSALIWGLKVIGVTNISLWYIADGIGSHICLPPALKLVHLGSGRARKLPLDLARQLREDPPDYLISMTSFVSFPAIVGWLLSGTRGRTKLIVSQHSTMSYKAYIENNRDWKFRLQPSFARLLYPLADAIHANSEFVLDDLLTKIGVKIPKHHTFVTTNPINLNVIESYASEEINHPWLKDKKQPVIVSVGRLARQKNFPLLLKAFQQVRQSVAAKLIILGKGKEEALLRKLINQLNLTEDVDLAGFHPNPWSFMVRSDLFVLSSNEEPFGLVLVEAMACGVPTIATDAIGGGPKSILGDNSEYGFLIPTQDLNSLSFAIESMLTDLDLQDKFRLASKQRCLEYRPEIVARDWINFLTKMTRK